MAQLTQKMRGDAPLKSKPTKALSGADTEGFNSRVSPLYKPLRMQARNEITSVRASALNSRQVYRPIWEAILMTSENAITVFQRPSAAMFRFTSLGSEGPAKIMQRIVETFARRGVKPLYVWAREVRDKDYEGLECAYEHYHGILFFDRALWFIGTLIKALKRLAARGWLESWYVSKKHDGGMVVYDLRNANEFESFQCHASYTAKTDTKEYAKSRRVFGRSQMVVGAKL